MLHLLPEMWQELHHVGLFCLSHKSNHSDGDEMYIKKEYNNHDTQ